MINKKSHRKYGNSCLHFYYLKMYRKININYTQKKIIHKINKKISHEKIIKKLQNTASV
jgi:hypothetical protein